MVIFPEPSGILPLRLNVGDERLAQLVSQIGMGFFQPLDQQVVDGQPDGPAPIGVAAEKLALRLGRPIVDGERVPVDRHAIWLRLVNLG